MDIFIISFVFLCYSALYTTVLTQKISGTTFNSSFDAIDSLRQNGQKNAVAIQNIIEAAIPGVSFPQFSTIPRTSFNCSKIQHNGFYADVETGCQVYRRCRGPRMQSYLCPNRTLFNQITLTCDWWYNVNCSKSQPFYMFSNVRLYNGDERFLDDSGYHSPSAGKWQTNQGSRPFTVRTSWSAVTSLISSKAKFTTEAATFAATSPTATPKPLQVNLNASHVGSISSTTQPTVAAITATNRQAPLEPGSGDPAPMTPPSATTNFTAAPPERTITNSTVTFTNGINGPARLEPGSLEPVPIMPPSAITNATADSAERTITQITFISTNGSSQLPLSGPGSGNNVTRTPQNATTNVTTSFPERPMTQSTATSTAGSNRLARLDPGSGPISVTLPSVSPMNVTEFPQWLITANTTESNSSNREVLIDFAGRPGTVPVRQTLVAELHSGHTSAGMNGPSVAPGNIPFRQGRKMSEMFPFLDYSSVPSLNVDKASDKDMEFYINGERYGVKKYLKHQLMIPFAFHGNSNVTTANKVQGTPASFRQLRRMT